VSAPNYAAELRHPANPAAERYARISESLRTENAKLDDDPPPERQTRIIGRIQSLREQLEAIRL